MGVKERIMEYANYKDISIYRLEKDAGMSKSSWNKTQNISSESCSNIAKIYTDLSTSWLLTGEGKMLKSNTSIPHIQSSTKNTIKYFPTISGSMGGVEFLDSPEETSIDIILPGFSECKFAVNAYGDSMYPVIKSGQVVLLMEWKESFIDWGHIYMVVTKSGYRAIKYLRPSDKNGFIRCESENKEFNPTFEVELNDIHKLFLVKGWVCRDVI